MNEELDDINEPSISADMGWQQMQSLLDTHMPVQKPLLKRMLLPYAAVAVLLTTLLFTSLPLDTYIFNASPARNTAFVNMAEIVGNKSLIQQNNIRTELIANNSSKHVIDFAKSNALNIDATFLNKNQENSPVTEIKKITGLAENIINDSIGTTIQKVASTAVADGNSSASLAKEVDKKIKTKGKWNLLGGVGINASLHSGQNLHPYPVLEGRFKVTSRFYVAGGVSPYSPVINKTVHSGAGYLNDTLSTMVSGSPTSAYTRLHYLDIPLSVGVYVTKNISVQSGIQMSILLNQKNKKITETYNYQVVGSNAPYNVPRQQYPVQHVRNIEYRFSAGLKYTLEKTTLGLTYQHGLLPVTKGTSESTNRNNLISLNLLFKIK